eukprot:1720829-Prymnesium_polylepis.2
MAVRPPPAPAAWPASAGRRDEAMAQEKRTAASPCVRPTRATAGRQVALLTSDCKTPAQQLDACFTMFDTERTGYLNRAEFEAMINASVRASRTRACVCGPGGGVARARSPQG